MPSTGATTDLADARIARACDDEARAIARDVIATPDRWTPLVRADRSEVWLAPHAQRRWIVKLDRGVGARAWLRAALGHGPRARAYAWGRALAGKSVVAEPIALLAGRHRDGPRFQATITPELTGPTLLEALTHDDVELARRAAEAAADHAIDLFNLNVWNRDHKPSNLVFDAAIEPGRLRLVDLDGLRRPLRDPHKAIRRMLTSIVLETIGVGRPLDPTVRWRLDTSFCRAAIPKGWDVLEPEDVAVDRLTAEVNATVEAHGDPTPKRDPLEAERRRRGE